MDVSDDEIMDDGKHSALLQKFTRAAAADNLDGVRREIGSFSKVIGNDSVDSGVVDLSKLVESSNTTSSSLADALNKTNEAKKLEPKPQKHQLVKAEQDVDYRELSKDMKKWEPLVKANRKAGKLQFPLDKEPLAYTSTTQDLSARSKAQPSSLEAQIYATLQASSTHIVDTTSGLSQEEEDALNNLEDDEVTARLKALRRHRILTAKQAARFKREKAIKSKKFKRLKTQHKMEKMKDQLVEKGLENALYEKRISERATLRHKRTGKWERKLAHYMKHDTAFRDEVQKKKALHKKLTDKVDQEESEDEKMSIGGGLSDSEISDDNEWTVIPKKKVYTKPEAVSNDNPDDDSETEMKDDELMSESEESNTEFLKEFKCLGETVLTGRNAGTFIPATNSENTNLLINPSNFLRATNPDMNLAISSKDNAMLQEAFEDDEDLFDELQEDSEKKRTLRAKKNFVDGVSGRVLD